MKNFFDRSIIVMLWMALATVRAQAEPANFPSSKVLIRGELALKQLVTPSFAGLPLKRKIFASYIVDAIEAGRDIAWLQQGEFGLPIRKILEQIWRDPSQLSSKERTALERYYFQILAGHGIYDRVTNSKFLLAGLDQDEFLALLERLKIPEPSADTMSAIFDPDFKRYAIAPAGEDPVQNSGVDFYGKGLTLEKLADLPDPTKNHPMSYPLWDEQEGKVSLQIHRIGGRFSEYLSKVDAALGKAFEFANPEERTIITLYRRILHTASSKDQEKAERAWVTNRTDDMAFTLGFIETYDDPLQTRGTWEGFLLLLNKDPEAEERSKRIRQSAVDFEERMPVDPEFKKTGDFTPPQSESAHMAYMAGGNNEVFFSGVNLPNSSEIRASLGSRSFTAGNKIHDIGQAPGSDYLPGEVEALYLPVYHDRLRKFGVALPFTIQVEFHEILGHGSGKDRTGVNSKEALKGQYAAMEESRAELAALYHLTDLEALEKHKILPEGWSASEKSDFIETVLVQFFTKHIVSLEKLKGATEVRQAHQLGRQMILNYMIEAGAIVIRISKWGVPQVELGKISLIRQTLGELWAKVQSVKGTGDSAELAKLIADLGKITEAQKEWVKRIAEAQTLLRRPERTIYLVPPMHRRYSADGKIVDVVQEYAPAGADLSLLFEREQKRAQANRCEDLL